MSCDISLCQAEAGTESLGGGTIITQALTHTHSPGWRRGDHRLARSLISRSRQLPPTRSNSIIPAEIQITHTTRRKELTVTCFGRGVAVKSFTTTC
jgi:hypothetical protein